VQPLKADIVAAFDAFVDFAVGQTLARRFDLPQLAHVAVEQRMAEFREHAGHRFVAGVVYGAGKIRERLSCHLRNRRAHLVQDLLAQSV
jgi:hypothetical protein